MLEQELKFALSGPEPWGEALRLLGPAEAVIEQTNHYFAGADGNVSRDWSLRLRREQREGGAPRPDGPLVPAESWEVTLKHGRKVSDGYFEATEINAPVTAEQALAILQHDVWPVGLEPRAQLESLFGVTRPVYLGPMNNVRYRCPLRDWGRAELDITTFPDGSVDHELEVETDQPDAVRQALLPLGNLLTPSASTKFSRFLSRR